jgi:hypothetical protein
MIARRWHGRVPAAKSDEYLRLMREVALPDYRSTAGNLGAWCLHRAEGEIVHVEMFTLWKDQAAIRRFAGDDIAAANITISTRISCSSWSRRSSISRPLADRAERSGARLVTGSPPSEG